MGVCIHCLLEPEVFSANKYRTDGKNLAQAYMAEVLSEEEAAEDGGFFDALTPLIGGTLSGGDLTWHEPGEGLTALAETIRRLREPAAEMVLSDPDLRDGCIHDLEQFMKQLREAEGHGASFSLVFDV